MLLFHYRVILPPFSICFPQVTKVKLPFGFVRLLSVSGMESIQFRPSGRCFAQRPEGRFDSSFY